MCLFARLPLLCRMQLLQLRYLSAHWLVRSHRLQACLPRWIVPFEAQTVERKYPDLSNIGFFSALVDEAPCWTPQPLRLMAHELPVLSGSRNAAVWYTAYIAVLCLFLEHSVCQLCLMGLCSQMIDGLLSLYWVLFTRRRVIRGDFDKVWQNTGDGFALGKLYLMGRQGWREWSFSVYHTSIKMIVSACFASIKLFSSYNTDWSH